MLVDVEQPPGAEVRTGATGEVTAHIESTELVDRRVHRRLHRVHIRRIELEGQCPSPQLPDLLRDGVERAGGNAIAVALIAVATGLVDAHHIGTIAREA